MSQEGLERLREIARAREKYESEKVFDYDIEDYDNWVGIWYEDDGDQNRCQACYGTGQDRDFDADCIVCYGEGFVDGYI